MMSDYGYVPGFLRITHTAQEKVPAKPLNKGEQFESRKEMQACKEAEKALGITRLNRGNNYAV